MRPPPAILAGLAVAAAAAVAIATASCTKEPPANDPGSADIELMIWGAPDEVTTVQHFLARFRVRYPRIRVKVTHVPDLGFRQKLEVRLRGGDPPDVFYCNYHDFADLAARGVLLDLEPHIAKDEGFTVDDFYPEVLDGFRHEGRLHGICKDFTPLVLYLNADLFDRWDVPRPRGDWTVDDFLAAARALTHDRDGDGRPDEYGFVVETWFGEWAAWVWLFGGEVLDEGRQRWLLGDPAFIDRNAAALEFLQDLMYGPRPVAPRAEITKDMGTSDLFMTGRIGMCTYGRWMCMQFRHITRFDWNVVRLPRGRPPHGRDASTLFHVAYAVSRETKHPEAAWRLVSFLTGREGQEATAHAGLAIPSMRPVAESEAFYRPRALEHLPFAVDPRPYLDSIRFARAIPHSRRWAEVDDRVRRGLEGVWNGTRRPREAIEAMQGDVQAILDRR